MVVMISTDGKYLGALVDYLDEGRLRRGLIVREQAAQVAVVEAGGRERSIARNLVMVRYPEVRATRENLAREVATVDAERAALSAELDLNLLWEVVQEHGRSYTAEELAELFFGRRAAAATSVMLEALFGDRLYFVRRHMEFVARSADQVERLRIQNDKVRLRSDASRNLRETIRAILEDGRLPPPDEGALLADTLRTYVENPFTRSADLTAIFAATVSDITPVEAAYEILERLGVPPPGPRFVVVGGIRTKFPAAALSEAAAIVAPERPAGDDLNAVTIDDDETLEVDDALSCEPLPDGNLRVRVHIALVADFVARDGPIDREAAARATTVYLPEATIWMLPERVGCDLASLSPGRPRHVLTTDLRLSPTGELLGYTIYPSRIAIAARLSYDACDAYVASEDATPRGVMVRRLYEASLKMRERRRAAGALLVTRREPKIKVGAGGEIEFKLIDNASPSRQLVAEFMVMNNYAAARYAADNRIPIIYRVQPGVGGEPATQRPRLSIHPDFHAGIGLEYYAQLSSPLRRYMDLVLQRQLLAAFTGREGVSAYQAEDLLGVMANAEAAEAEGKELERRAKRFWILRYLERTAIGRPLEAIALRDGASAELDAYAVRGTLHGAPNLSSQSRIFVQIARIEPIRGWLTFDYLAPGVPQAGDARG
ncbi:MAG TPA: ribonuclease catalytic domain-containing protein [Candidatus Binataceae bacterium]|nr:ribonuclease catalytic domain-containing protein [Candidatus Binataceae bacterium]